ncbi:hypothetical protein [Exiguobacterium sp. E4787]|nr:hypothetical protein [Exiguobacterium sp. E4787]
MARHKKKSRWKKVLAITLGVLTIFLVAGGLVRLVDVPGRQRDGDESE